MKENPKFNIINTPKLIENNLGFWIKRFIETPGFNVEFVSQMSAEQDGIHHHPEDEINLIITGEVECIFDDTKFNAKKGDVIFIPAKYIHTIRAVEASVRLSISPDIKVYKELPFNPS